MNSAVIGKESYFILMWRPDVFSPRYVMTAQFGEWKRWGSSTTGTLVLLLVVLTTGR
jgi:hypothetical protein